MIFSLKGNLNTSLLYFHLNMYNITWFVKCSFSVSPVGQTPRSARSDQNVKSLEEEIDEEIEEELSVAEDLLKSDNSGVSQLLLNNFNICVYFSQNFKITKILKQLLKNKFFTRF